MTQEEKAKRYDETLEQLRGLIEGTREDKCAIVEEDIIHIFPELKESKDEKIRKVIRGWIYTRPDSFFDNGISKDDILAWLEKQGEQKPKWSEEDECYMGECISAIATKDGWTFEDKRKTKHWLKSLKKRMEE